MQRAQRPRFSRAPLLLGDGPLAKASPVLAFLAVLAVFVVGVLVGGVLGAALLGVLALGVLVLLATTWSALSGQARLVRLIALAALIAIALSQLW